MGGPTFCQLKTSPSLDTGAGRRVAFLFNQRRVIVNGLITAQVLAATWETKEVHWVSFHSFGNWLYLLGKTCKCKIKEQPPEVPWFTVGYLCVHLGMGLGVRCHPLSFGRAHPGGCGSVCNTSSAKWTQWGIPHSQKELAEPGTILYPTSHQTSLFNLLLYIAT